METAVEYHMAVALIGALKSFMLTPSHYEIMLRIRSPMRFLTMLKETQYGEILPEPSPMFETEDFEVRLLEHYYQVFSKLLAVTPPFSKPTLEAILRRHEINCVKSLLRAVAYHIEPKEVLKKIVPVGRYDLETCRKILDAGSLSEAVKLLEADLRMSMTSAMRLFEETRSLTPLEAVLDKYTLTQVWDSLENLPGYDREIAEHLLGIEIDSINVMNVLRARKLGLEVGRLLIPVHRYVEPALLNSMSRAPSMVKALEFLKDTPYGLFAVKASKEPSRALFRLEVGFKRYLAQESERVFLGDWFHIGTLIGFLNLKLYEVLDLIAMFNGKVEGLDLKKVKEALILHQTGRL